MTGVTAPAAHRRQPEGQGRTRGGSRQRTAEADRKTTADHVIHLASQLGVGADGKLFQDDESIFTMPAGHGTPAMNPVDGEADLTVTGTYIGVYPPRHAWGTWHHLTLIVGLPADAAGLRHQLADGRFKVIGRGVVDGRKAIELGMTGLNPSKTGLHATAARLWVDAASYLPLRQVLQFSTGRQYKTDYRFFSPTAANLAKLRPVIPTPPPDHAAARPGAFQVNRWPVISTRGFQRSHQEHGEGPYRLG